MWLALAVVGAGWYLWRVRKLRKRGDSWPVGAHDRVGARLRRVHLDDLGRPVGLRHDPLLVAHDPAHAADDVRAAAARARRPGAARPADPAGPQRRLPRRPRVADAVRALALHAVHGEAGRRRGHLRRVPRGVLLHAGVPVRDAVARVARR